ncbi:metal ABC transporter permease [Methylotenera sp.]|uniref:metal ABC transporter permease n=1 Tax=Methylotenera sp. TaxID=2051956 RepID=UPI00248713AF|nr:metal ABC transporter permease [Methylotenera sp.]MDI1361576.1 metal ABC transporter permease [Methylotenera sp.]
MNLDTLNLNILGPAFLAGLLVLATHVPLGQQVLKRGIVFIDLAVAQIAALGVIAADAMGWEPQGIKVQIAAVSAALLGALLLTWTEKKWPEVQEALIGVFFVLAASAGILLLANNPHGGEHLKDLLAGQILWVSMSQLLPVSILSVLILAVWFGLKDKMGRAGFYGLFALAVTASVQMVGIYLVFSSLIIPALAVRNWPESRKMIGAYLIGSAAYIFGLALSAIFDLPSGAVIVWCLAAVGVLANVFIVKSKVSV